MSGNSMLVEFTLVSEGSERTRLWVAESGLDVIAWSDDDKVRYAEEHRDGWSNFMDRLAGLLAGQLPESPAVSDHAWGQTTMTSCGRPLPTPLVVASSTSWCATVR